MGPLCRTTADRFVTPLPSSISSIASTAKYRVLSFTGSFNDRTRLLHVDAELGPTPAAEEAPAPPAQAQVAASAPVVTAAAPSISMDIEAAAAAATPPLAPSAADEGHSQDAEAKRVAKSVQTVCLFAASASLVLFVNLPISKDDDVVSSKPTATAMYDADLAFISLGFFASLGLSMFSIVARPGDGEAAVARVQKWGMVVAVASVLVAFTLRMCMMPVAS
nr:unnamed protein product [Digitaria exilis]